LASGFSISWQTTQAEASRSGDLEYVVVTYLVERDIPKGKIRADRGKLIEVSKNQADTSWKCLVDTFNSDLPLPPPAPAKK